MADGLSARHRVIGRALRDFLHRAGLQLDDAAAVLGCDRSKVTRVEEGERGIRLAVRLAAGGLRRRSRGEGRAGSLAGAGSATGRRADRMRLGNG